MSQSTPPDRPPAPVLPLHELPKGAETHRIRRGPGRPRKIELAPTHEERAYHEDRAKDRAQHVDGDPLVRAVRDRAGGEIVHEALLGLARESAVLEWQREHAPKKGRDPAMLSSRIIDSAMKMAAILLAREKLGASDLSVSPATVKRLQELWLRHVEEIVSGILPAADAARLMAAYARKIEGLEGV